MLLEDRDNLRKIVSQLLSLVLLLVFKGVIILIMDSISWWSSPYPTTHVWVWNEIWSGVYGPIFFILNRMKLYFISFVDVVEAINWVDVCG